MSTTADLNDYSSRVNITGVTIASIPIDIVAQTIGNIAIDIAAASMGAIAISINVADIVGNLPIDIVAQTIGNISIDIAAQTVGNIGIDIAANSFGNLPIDIVAQTIGNIGISLNANTAGNITVDIAAQTMVGNLSIDIAANSFGNLPIDIVAQTIGNIGIDLAANTLGNLTIDIAAQTVGNIGIDVAAQTVDLNIKTSGGVNIIIDQLEQGAYTERRSELSNDNGVTTPTAPPSSYTNTTYKGKFYPRGCRGLLRHLSVYCKRTATGTLTLSYAPHPGMGAIGSVVITPGAAWDWKLTTILTMWNYDSIFIWVSACSADVSYGYEAATPDDGYTSPDSGATWIGEFTRPFIRVTLQGMTVGDIPVSGTINNIEIPAVTGSLTVSEEAIAGGATEPIINIDGAGEVNGLLLKFITVLGSVPRLNIFLHFTIDNVLTTSVLDSFVQDVASTVNTPTDITFTEIDNTVNAEKHRINFRKPFKFRRSFKLEIRNTAAAGNTVNVSGHYWHNLIK